MPANRKTRRTTKPKKSATTITRALPELPPGFTPQEGPQGRMVIWCDGTDAPPIGAEWAKEVIGWEVEGDGKFGDNYDLNDHFGKKVRLLRNAKNRPLNPKIAGEYGEEALTQHWAPDGANGEPIIVSAKGNVLSGQKRLVGLILADQRFHDPKEATRWQQYSKEPPTMSTLVVWGVPETDRNIQTYDSVQPRDAGDVFYSLGLFPSSPPKEREKLCKGLGHAVRLIWDRAGLSTEAYSVHRSNTQVAEFAKRHPRMQDAVLHIYGEDSDGGVKDYCTPGYAAGLMYLMASGHSDPKAYLSEAEPSEESLDLGQWDMAETFWTLLASKSPSMKRVAEAFNDLDLAVQNNEPIGGVPSIRQAILARCWGVFSEGSDPGEQDTAWRDWLKVTPGGLRVVSEVPSVGGIDLGKAERKGLSQVSDDDEEPDPDEVETRRAEVDAEKNGGDETEPKATPKLREQLEELRAEYGERILLFRTRKGTIAAYGSDSYKVGKVIKRKPERDEDEEIYTISFAPERLDEIRDEIIKLGHPVTVLDAKGTTENFDPPEPPKASTKPQAKPSKGKARRRKLRGGTTK